MSGAELADPTVWRVVTWLRREQRHPAWVAALRRRPSRQMESNGDSAELIELCRTWVTR